jgi:Uma2 family endonuclease
MSSTAEATHVPLTVDDFIAFLDREAGDKRYQLLDGAPVAMINVTRRHSLITGNVFSALRGMARRRGCEAHTSDMLVTNSADPHFAAVPDVFVRCGPASDTIRKVEDAVLVVEVLSPSTMADDRGYKFKRYATIPSLQQILFVYQGEMRVESWTRQGSEWVLLTLSGNDTSIPLPALGDALSMTEVYDATSS